MTKSQRMRLSAVMISSTIPSAKYSCSGSPLMLANGRTAIEGLSGSGSGFGRPGLAGLWGRPADPVHTDWSGDILEDLLLSHVLEGVIEPVPDLIADDSADANPTGLR